MTMHYYLTIFTLKGRVIDRGWMMAKSADELIEYASTMRYGIALTYLGEADTTSAVLQIVPGTESEAALSLRRYYSH